MESDCYQWSCRQLLHKNYRLYADKVPLIVQLTMVRGTRCMECGATKETCKTDYIWFLFQIPHCKLAMNRVTAPPAPYFAWQGALEILPQERHPGWRYSPKRGTQGGDTPPRETPRVEILPQEGHPGWRYSPKRDTQGGDTPPRETPRVEILPQERHPGWRYSPRETPRVEILPKRDTKGGDTPPREAPRVEILPQERHPGWRLSYKM